MKTDDQLYLIFATCSGDTMGEVMAVTYRSVTIGGGIQLCHVPSDKFKTVHMALLVRRRLSKAEATQTALIPPVLARGSAAYPTLSAINARAEALYGAVLDCGIVKKGEEQIIQFYAETLSEAVANDLPVDGLALLGAVALNPVKENGGFRAATVLGAIKNQRRILAGRVNNKKTYALERLIEEQCKNEPFGVSADGYAADLAAINPVGLYAHYERVLAEAPIDLIVVGDCDTDKLARQTERLFDGRRSAAPTPVAEADGAFPSVQPDARPRVVTERQAVAQTRLCLGFRCGVRPQAAAFYALLVLNDLLGGGANNRLFAKIREQESLCYDIGSLLYRFKSILCVQAGIARKDGEKVERLVLAELDDIKNGGLSDGETDRAKNSLIKEYATLSDDPHAVMDFYFAEALLREQGGVQATIEGIRAVSKAAVQAVAAKITLDTVYILCDGKEASS